MEDAQPSKVRGNVGIEANITNFAMNKSSLVGLHLLKITILSNFVVQNSGVLVNGRMAGCGELKGAIISFRFEKFQGDNSKFQVQNPGAGTNKSKHYKIVIHMIYMEV